MRDRHTRDRRITQRASKGRSETLENPEDWISPYWTVFCPCNYTFLLSLHARSGFMCLHTPDQARLVE